MKPRVLIVDSDPTWVQLAWVVLQPEYEISSASSASEALEECLTSKPQLVVCDLGLARTPGIDMLRRLQADPEYAGIAVLLATDNPKLAKQPPPNQGGSVRGLLLKSCSRKELKEAIRGALGEKSPAEGQKRQYKILVADDQGNFLQLLDIVVHQLATHDRSVVYHKARDGREALELVRIHNPDLILSDMVMPGMTGVELMRELGKDGKFKDIPCILMTANRMPAQQKDVLFKDMPALRGILEKPFTIEGLRVTIAALLEEKS